MPADSGSSITSDNSGAGRPADVTLCSLGVPNRIDCNPTSSLRTIGSNAITCARAPLPPRKNKKITSISAQNPTFAPACCAKKVPEAHQLPLRWRLMMRTTISPLTSPSRLSSHLGVISPKFPRIPHDSKASAARSQLFTPTPPRCRKCENEAMCQSVSLIPSLTPHPLHPIPSVEAHYARLYLYRP